MALWTIETTYRLPVYRHKTYEAETLAQACRLAIEDDDWNHEKRDCESVGETYVTGIWSGADIAYSGAAQPSPHTSPRPRSGSQSSSRYCSVSSRSWQVRVGRRLIRSSGANAPNRRSPRRKPFSPASAIPIAREAQHDGIQREDRILAARLRRFHR
jgi:hypothetical protein